MKLTARRFAGTTNIGGANNDGNGFKFTLTNADAALEPSALVLLVPLARARFGR